MKINSYVPESSLIFRYLAYALATRAKQSVYDYRYFSNFKLRGTKCDTLPKNLADIGNVEFKVNSKIHTVDSLVEGTDTLSLLVVKDGHVVYQHFSNGVNESTPLLAYSVTKSFFSSYLAKLEQFGLFSFSDELRIHLPNLPEFIGKRSLQSLMNMESGIRYTHGKGPTTDMVRFWFSPNIRKELLSLYPGAEAESYFLYNDIHLHLLYRLLDHKIFDIASDFYHNLWRSFEMTYNGHFLQDSCKTRWLKMDGGLSLTAYDMAKFGQIYLNNGALNGEQVLPESWCQNIKRSTGVRRDLDFWDLYRKMDHRWYPIFKQGRTYYKNFWWGTEQDGAFNDIYAMGILGQFVYVSTRNNVVIVRQGNSWGIDGWWPSIFEKLADKVGEII